MEITSINAELLAKMFLAGAKNLDSKKEWINELNVFPVPDGDTGTNMTMTIMSAAREVSAIETPTMENLSKAISSGSLRGARGNSGVILSQLFRGFCKVIRKHEEIDIDVMCEAAEKAVETAYKAVMKPKEGTILTVAKGAADKCLELADETEDLIYFCDEVIKHADYVLSQTPELLPVLKQAGVVDSGGQGLLQVLKGAFDALCGKEVDYSIEESPKSSGVVRISAETEKEIRFGYCTEFIIVLNKPLSSQEEREYKDYLESIGDSIVVVADDEIVKTHVHTNDPGLAIQKALTHGSLSKIKIDNMREEHQEKLIKDAEKIAAQQKAADQAAAAAAAAESGTGAPETGNGTGDVNESKVSSGSDKPAAYSSAAGRGDIHKGVNTVSAADLESAAQSQAGAGASTVFGSGTGIDSGSGRNAGTGAPATPEGTTVESEDALNGSDAEEPKEMGFVSVSIGDGMNEIFRGLGVDSIIEGGQTMNPSTEDVMNAVASVNARTVFILPNNKNIILAANQAASLVKDKQVIVIPTKTIPQGITALVNYIPEHTPEENRDSMISEIDMVRTGQVTFAVRDTEIDGKTIRENDIMGIGDSGILAVGRDRKEVSVEMIEEMIDDDSAIVSVYYGSDATEEEAQEIADEIAWNHPDVEVEINSGGQPIYYYVVSVE